jgi:hypothetical protein
MKGKNLLMVLVLAGIICVIIGFIMSNQLQISKEGFGIYLLENDELVISDKEIISYNKTSHEIKLKEEGVKKIKALRVPVSGRPFVIKLNCKEIYNGAFWSPISSKSYSGIVILIEDNSVKIENGYPSSEFFKGIDPRNNSEIFSYFQKVEKLVQ